VAQTLAHTSPANLISKKPHRGINAFLLAFAGYGSQYWLSFRQAQALSGNVRRGEHGTKIVFWKCKTCETESADGEIEERRSAFLRYYTVFNLEQTEGLKALLTLPPACPIESAEEIVKGMPNPPAFEQDSRAAYIPSRDTVTMPSRAAFESLLDRLPRIDTFNGPREATRTRGYRDWQRQVVRLPLVATISVIV
jgi:antirestriction protein ArdC